MQASYVLTFLCGGVVMLALRSSSDGIVNLTIISLIPPPQVG
jgi:hypothetical protein